MTYSALNIRGKIWNNTGLKYLILPQGKTVAHLNQGQAANNSKVNASSALNNQTANNNLSKNAREKPHPFVNASLNNSRPHYAKDYAHLLKKPDIKPLIPEKKWTLISPESWPLFWRNIYDKTKKGKIAWTYWDLGRDLLFGGNSSNPEENERCKKRGQLLRKLFKDLNTHGQNVLWPVAVPENAQSQNNAINLDIYWSGLRYFGCRAVVLMGSPVAWPILEQKNLKPFTAITKNGYHIWILRDIEALVSNDDFYASSIRLLKSLNLS